MVNMTYATSAPAAPTGPQGSNPVSEISLGFIFFLILIALILYLWPVIGEVGVLAPPDPCTSPLSSPVKSLPNLIIALPPSHLSLSLRLSCHGDHLD